jgi:Rad3-related DNA helicase
VDLPEADNVAATMICKMPYLNLGDPQIKAKQALPGGQMWYMVKTLQSLVQMSFRNVRSERQRSDIYIYDRQFDRLRSATKSVIPTWWTDAIRQVETPPEKIGQLI